MHYTNAYTVGFSHGERELLTMASRSKRIPTMRCLTDVGRMMNVVFKEGRRGVISTQDMSRFIQCLNVLAGIFKIEKELDHEDRMKAIEKILEDSNYR